MLETNFSEINKQKAGQKLAVGGFVNSVRDHGGLIFIDLRSQTDLLQCVIDPQQNPEAFKIAEHLSSESVLKIEGEIRERGEGLANPKLATGEVELVASKFELISKARLLPFDINADEKNMAGEETRLKYRYLDLRRPKLKEMMKLKHKLFLAVRNWFDKEDFIEIQTPILANSSPEGARDFLIPSRLHPGKFYALPQAPQQFKQLLMVGGFNKYFQIAPCFRDEDPRADRHPGDFYQIDSEIAWASQDDIFEINEKLVKEVFADFSEKKLLDADKSFVRLTYTEAVEKYGSDKPDLRYGLEWKNVKDLFRGTNFTAFADLCSDTEQNQNSRLQALVVPGGSPKLSRKDLNAIQDLGRKFKLPGIAYIQYQEDGVKSPIFKFFGDDENQAQIQQKIQTEFGTKTGDLIFFVGHQNKNLVHKVQDALRRHLAQKLNLIDENALKFAWVYDFPFFEIDDESGEVDFGHNPFSMWQEEENKTKLETLMDAKKEGRLGEIKAIQYDCVCNGYEVLSGGVRNPFPDCLSEAFQVVGYTAEEVKNRFGHMMEAYSYGAPEHAGFAWGLDRLFMVLIGEENIRETIAFPKNGSGMDSMMQSPTKVREGQLKELGVRVVV